MRKVAERLALLAGGLVLAAGEARGEGEADELAGPRAVRTLHLDVLGRPPFDAERERWVGRPAAELVDALLAAEEHWGHWYAEQLYYLLLIDNFRPTGERLAAVPGDLAAGRLDVRTALHHIALSSSFDQRNPGADTFVTVVLEQLCGLEVDKVRRELEIGKKVYEGKSGLFLGTTGSSQADVVRIAIESKPFLAHFLRREHLRLVHAEPAAADVRSWSGALASDPRAYASIVRSWLTGPAYAARLERREPMENRVFVRAMFVDLAGRLPTEEEAEPLREALDGLADATPLRGVLARMLLDSGKARAVERESIGDAATWIRAQFERLLARSPTPAEQETFISALQDPACRPETILYALVTSPEYAGY